MTRVVTWLLQLLGVYDGDWGGPGKDERGWKRPTHVTLPETLLTEPEQWKRIREEKP